MKGINEFMTEVFNGNDEEKGILTCLPLQCGTGKSRWVTEYIGNSLRSGDWQLIVTDSTERMRNYTNYDDFFTEYLFHNDIKIITADNIKTDYSYLYRSQILVMSTQRYFSLSVEEINRICKKRQRIIFDERPILSEQIQIGIDTLNRIDTTLINSLDNNVNIFDKEFIVTEFEIFRRKIMDIMTRYEASNTLNGKPYTKYYFVSGDSMTSDDEKFFNLIEKYKAEISSYDYSCVKYLYSFKRLIDFGATFVSIKKNKRDKDGEYKNYFVVLMDNTDKIAKVDCKAYCLCASCDIDPMFDIPICKIIDCSDFNRPLDSLTINLINVNTSKTKLIKKANSKLLHLIVKDALSVSGCNTIFTHKQTESLITNHNVKTEHFGNIAGRNEYRHETAIAQIGLNRAPELFYSLQTAFNLTSNTEITSLETKRIFNLHLLQDLEQNIFRSKIREKDNADDITYTVYFDTKRFKGLIEMITARYEPLGATVNLIDTPYAIRSLKSDSRTQSDGKPNLRQRIKQFIVSLPNKTVFTNNDICSAIGITQTQLKTAKRSKDLSELLSSMKIDKRSYMKMA